jgi:hypothetical protein
MAFEKVAARVMGSLIYIAKNERSFINRGYVIVLIGILW